jgi:outer membrane protein assembly factor BamB
MLTMQSHFSKGFIIVLIFTFCFCIVSIRGQNDINFNLPITVCSEIFKNNVAKLGVASDNQLVFVPNLNGNLKSVDIVNKEKIWESELGGRIISAPVLDKNNKQNLFIATTSFNVEEYSSANNISTTPDASLLRSISKTTGLTNWSAIIAGAGRAEKLFLYDFRDKIIVVSQNGFISAFDKINGQPIWKKSLDKILTSMPFFSEDKLTVAVDKEIVTFSLENASILFQSKIRSAPTAFLLLGNKILFWGDSLGNVYALDVVSGKIFWRFRIGGQISYIIFTSKGILLTSYDNFVYLVSADKGRALWKKRLSGRIVVEPLVTGNFVMVTSLADSDVFVLDLSNGKPVNQFSLTEENLSLSSPLLLDNLLVFITVKGLFVFSHSGGKCISMLRKT